MPIKPKKKTKSHIFLIIILSTVGTLLLMVIPALMIDKPWNNKDSISIFSDRSYIDIDNQFLSKVKNHKYQKLTDTKDFTFDILLNTFALDEKAGSYTIQIPKNWTKDEDSYYSGFFWAVWDEDRVSYNTIETQDAYDVTDEPENVNPADYYTPEVAMDKYIETFGAFGPYDVIDQYSKNINGQDFLCSVVKTADITGDPMYQFIYLRLLDKGSLMPSYLVASTSISEEDREYNKDKFLKNLYDIENTIGGFDESKVKTNKF